MVDIEIGKYSYQSEIVLAYALFHRHVVLFGWTVCNLGTSTSEVENVGEMWLLYANSRWEGSFPNVALGISRVRCFYVKMKFWIYKEV